MKISLKELNLKIGNKYTLLKPNSLVPELYQFTLVNYYISNFAQHENNLFLIVKLKGCRKLTRIIIAKEAAYLLKDWNFQKAWRKEKESENISRLHRVNINDIKDNKDFVIAININDSFICNEDNYSFIDFTTDYILENNCRGKEQLNHKGYYNYIKELIRDKFYNLSDLIRQCRAWEYIYIVELLSKIQEEY